ncbi:putative oxidoreductase [Streptoalloteichus tenebrarius]|uniref:Oxidoreductase n=1 Tax=Streptoalloteichus tenebrarius (strain ATCC 17920 / DSM 40477 / JCM 4838 / CBS 697.72 / NBRC 16177 / NCIMB 11028 / NRRL B-12390 / A12253. 1 / ISP 5477) TaxID=1933 RepID=A0ABT1HPN5_STRSD|nr:aldo/keto reductase [Streptoalloteichus tenebrarius]MCP2257481.1 putative oxidoreductase [Streptoalloteichus tenebrarius]BFE98430.1 aldo/keto reductase [Streptoalloteichus tenebrarius]
MEQRQLGRSGLRVSRLALGTMTWGRDTDADEAANQLVAFVEAGGTLVDTADVYCDGDSERILGGLLGEVVPRDEIVVATKAVARRHDGPFGGGASRGALLTALDHSLRRLGVDHVDLWQLHAWDPSTPLEETLGAVDAAVTSGKVRYVGVSNYSGWQLGTAAALQRAVPGRALLISTQVEYSLLERGVEREIVPAAAHHGIGLLPWAPLGRGVLTGKYRSGTPADSRGASPHFAAYVEHHRTDRAARIVQAVATAADGLGTSPLAVALAWVRDRPGVVAPVVGARDTAQLTGSLAAEDLTLPSEIRAALDDVSAVEFGYPERPLR